MYTLTVTVYRVTTDNFSTIKYAHPSFESAQVASALVVSDWFQNARGCIITPGSDIEYDASRATWLGHRYS